MGGEIGSRRSSRACWGLVSLHAQCLVSAGPHGPRAKICEVHKKDQRFQGRGEYGLGAGWGVGWMGVPDSAPRGEILVSFPAWQCHNAPYSMFRLLRSGDPCWLLDLAQTESPTAFCGASEEPQTPHELPSPGLSRARPLRCA